MKVSFAHLGRFGQTRPALASLGVAKSWTEVVAPVLRAIGERWARAGRWPRNGRWPPRLRRAGSVARAGAPAMFLSGPVVPDVLRVVAGRFAPSAVVVWSMTSPSADVRTLRTLHAEGVPVRPAGPGWRGLPTVGEPLPPSFSDALAAFGS
jgi:hypothetical protein